MSHRHHLEQHLLSAVFVAVVVQQAVAVFVDAPAVQLAVVFVLLAG